MTEFPFVWAWGPSVMRALDRKGQRCRVIAREDGFRTVTSRNGLRRAPQAPLAAQLDLDGRLHEIGPETRQERLFAPAPEQLAGQTHLDTDESEER